MNKIRNFASISIVIHRTDNNHFLHVFMSITVKYIMCYCLDHNGILFEIGQSFDRTFIFASKWLHALLHKSILIPHQRLVSLLRGTALQTRTFFLSDWSLLSYRLLSLFKIEFSAVLFDRPIINMTQHILYYLYEIVFAFFAFTAEKCRYNRWLQFFSRKPQILKFQHAKRPIDSTMWHCWTHRHACVPFHHW